MTQQSSDLADLVILVPDRDTEAAVKGILSRPQALGIREIGSTIFTHIERDPGCFKRSHDFLRPMINTYKHALVIFDRAGCGQEPKGRETIERIVEKNLSISGWENRAAAVVIDPELEVWVWSDSPEVANCLGWEPGLADLRKWLTDRGLWPRYARKPVDPKLAVEQVLRQLKKPRSSAVYKLLAQRVSFERCIDPAFSKFKAVMQKWFGR
ncbi:MAG: methylation-associated defense system protein MAD4 [Desulfotomaculales bacterium]